MNFSPLTSSQNYGLPANISASALIKTGTGTIQGIVVNSHTAGVIKLSDALTSTTPLICNTITLGATERWIPLFGAKFTTGLYLTLVSGTADLTVVYN